jgi:hypothetical protein
MASDADGLQGTATWHPYLQGNKNPRGWRPGDLGDMNQDQGDLGKEAAPENTSEAQDSRPEQ